MREKVYVDRLFADYEDSPEVRDFKEEITANLIERVKANISNGLGEDKAFDMAAAELGDISAIADEVGRKKRNEAIGQMYIKAKVPFTKRTAAGLTAATGLILLAVGIALVAFFGKSDAAWAYYISAVLLSAACGLYAYFGLTQETAAHYAVKNRRALAYGIVCLLAFLGAGLGVVTFLAAGMGLAFALGIKAIFIIPAICVLVFMLVTEPKRQKPWLKALVEHEIEDSMKFHADMVDPVKAAKFGVASGGLWVLAMALFVTFMFLNGFQHPWLVFPFALAIQVFMVTTIFKKSA
ncbi:MAG: permease prefix domain 1-containing protein [Oscillospiraceae bacterium]|nr:permease prefix domain 1-containing protein [Oscillospiraceae bacterium]